MGRNSTGAITTREVQRIEISYLLKSGFIKKGCQVSGTLSWNDGSNIGFLSEYSREGKYIKFNYSCTNCYSGEVTHYDYMIQLKAIPSNLGKGKVLYFVCPITGRKARILYMCYGSQIWKCRTAYQNRIYYNSQISSKLNYHNTRYWDLNEKLNILDTGFRKSHYQGKVTRGEQRIMKLKIQRQRHDDLRVLSMPKGLLKSMQKFGLEGIT